MTGGCWRCGFEHDPAGVMEWLWAWREHKPKPPGGQQAALFCLVTRMHPATGCGWAYLADTAMRAQVSEDTAKRAVAWARDQMLLGQLVRGRHAYGRSRPSCWRLIIPGRE